MSDVKVVGLRIFSLHEELGASGLPEGERERTESCATGCLKKAADGALVLSYIEADGENSQVHTSIRIKPDKISVQRRGGIDSIMVFEEGVIHRSVYSLPPYQMDMEILTRRIRQNMSLTGGELQLVYEMKVGGARRSAIFRIEVKAEK